MSLHINRFIDLVKACESRGQREVTLSLRDAKDLHGDITKLLLALEQIRSQTNAAAVPVQVEVTGGTFKTPGK